MIHKLKTVQPYYSEIESGKKTFEVRKNDRNFHTGDYLRLVEYNPCTDSYSGEEVARVITYVLNDPQYCKEGYVILGINKLPPSFMIDYILQKSE